MNRKYNLKLDLQFRCNNSIMKFNQIDNNTSDFFIRITNSGKLVDIEKAIVVLAIIKPSGKVASQFVEIENGTCTVDTAEDLAWIGNETYKGTLACTVINQTEDINLNNKEWTAIGSKDHPLKAAYNGNGHKVSNVYLIGSNIYAADDKVTSYGLIGYTDMPVNDLAVEGVTIKYAADKNPNNEEVYIGGLIGRAVAVKEVRAKDVSISGDTGSAKAYIGACHIPACSYRSVYR